MTTEHFIDKEMIKRRQIINVYYDNLKEERKIQLNPEERFIKNFCDIKIDVTVIEILPKDNIPQNYFLLPFIDYMDNYNKLNGQDLAIMQYFGDQLYLSVGKIKYVTNYEFAFDFAIEEGSSGSPILLKETNKVVGIYKGCFKSRKENYGDLIYPIFSYFKNFQENINGQYNTDT